MNSRIWDPQGKYQEGFIKEYKYWILEVSFHQHTLGCYIIFANRNVEKISELKGEELSELTKVMSEIENTVTKEFHPQRFNYLQLGNNLKHLHFHGIPRYETKKEFGGKIWTDKTFGHPPIWSKKETSRELVKAIKERISPIS